MKKINFSCFSKKNNILLDINNNYGVFRKVYE